MYKFEGHHDFTAVFEYHDCAYDLTSVGTNCDIAEYARMHSPKLTSIGESLTLEYNSELIAPKLTEIKGVIDFEENTNIYAPNLKTVCGYTLPDSQTVLNRFIAIAKASEKSPDLQCHLVEWGIILAGHKGQIFMKKYTYPQLIGVLMFGLKILELYHLEHYQIRNFLNQTLYENPHASNNEEWIL